jgi:hypothetical protein
MKSDDIAMAIEGRASDLLDSLAGSLSDELLDGSYDFHCLEWQVPLLTGGEGGASQP